ncbi:MAG: NAD-dependent epimerase/dehydratase family protein [Bacteroidia bacterium]|nr:NAD-dependent epimerase/dehydratase family protein [Bacteroidia bacterium]MCC6769299.1 NAD-dependent epimerase/dehydratase family protein [Bacteroidia bacterium]
MENRIAVTGAAGFIGAYLVKRLVTAGYQVVAVDNFTRGIPERLDGLDEVLLATVDILDKEALSEAFRGCRAVFHLAAINGTENFYTIPDKILEVGVLGMFNVVDACYQNNIRELVIASSAEAYQAPAIVPTPETEVLKVPDPSNPRYSYGASKLISEVIAMNFHRDFFTKLQIFRPHNIYGPDMGSKHVIPQFILRALDMAEEQPEGLLSFPIQGNGEETRAFCYVDDLVDAFITMYQLGGHREIYHLGNPEEVSINQVVAEVFRNLNRKFEVVHQPVTAGSVSRRCPDISKIAALGYRPAINLSEGVARTFKWYAANRELIKGYQSLL